MNRILSVLLLSLVLLAGCSDLKYSDGKPALGNKNNTKLTSSIGDVQPYPWEIWPLQRDLSGNLLVSRVLLEGDENLRAGKRDAALALYLKTDLTRLSPAERDARTIRVASTYLTLDKPRDTLSTLSSYFRSIGRSESEVDGRFSLLFAFAYGRQGDVDQSLAWFSRVARLSNHGAGVTESAESGVRLLLRSLSDEQLYKLGASWMSDSFIYSLVGQERKRRTSQGYIPTTLSGKPFWDLNRANSTETSAVASAIVSAEGPVPVGVLLPLSGSFASLGKGIQQGIQLAVDSAHAGRPELPSLTMEVRDDAGDVVQSAAIAQELINNGKAAVVLGPLLTEPAVRVSELARQQGKSILTFSKSAAFQTGGGVFRLGPTSQTQVESLVEVATTKLGLSRFAMVFPKDAAGEEFARFFRESVAARGLTLLHESSYSRDDLSQLLNIAKEVEKLPVDALFLPDSLTVASRFFSYLMGGGIQTKVRPLGTASWDNARELQQSRAVLDSAVFVSPFFAASQRPAISQFVEAYKARYQMEPDFLAAQGYDAAGLILEGLAKERSTHVPLSEALHSVGTYEGLTGQLRARDDGEIERQFAIVQFREGILSEVIENTTNSVTENNTVADQTSTGVR